MMASSHVPFAGVCWLGYCLVTGTPVTAPQTLLAAFCGLLPDIDSPSSRLGRVFPFISMPLGAVIGHRGFSHSLIAALLVIGGLIYYGQLYPLASGLGMILPPVLVGYLSHLLGDMCTVSGIPLMWPNKRKYTLPLTFKTNSVAEHVIVLPLCFLIFWGYYQTHDYPEQLGETVTGLFTQSGITQMIKGMIR